MDATLTLEWDFSMVNSTVTLPGERLMPAPLMRDFAFFSEIYA